MRKAISAPIAIVVTAAVCACATAVDPAPPAVSSLTGRYDVTGATTNESFYAAQALVTPRGDGYDVVWYLPNGSENKGFGIQVDDVFGVVLNFDRSYSADINVIAYKIAGGELTGTRLSGANPDGKVGHEILRGSPDLSGRYEIAASENPYGAPLQFGHVDIERRGDIYKLTWYTPERHYVGTGIRMGDVLVVGYNRDWAPGVAAYCVRNGSLIGRWTRADVPTPGEETLVRAGATPGLQGSCS